MGNLSCCYAGDHRYAFAALWLQKNGSHHVGGCNPLLMVAALSLRNEEVVWRRDYATYGLTMNS